MKLSEKGEPFPLGARVLGGKMKNISAIIRDAFIERVPLDHLLATQKGIRDMKKYEIDEMSLLSGIQSARIDAFVKQNRVEFIFCFVAKGNHLKADIYALADQKGLLFQVQSIRKCDTL